ncbi:MAG: SMI1/KNR4 family protein [Lachnospiraceae bacterium]|nr:SMI1/KNR4 family protein [Lachnospiraceae bacterium]
MIQTEERFVQKAFQALCERGAAQKSMLTASTVTDDDLNAFEKNFDIVLPSLFRTYLKAYCYDFSVICAPVPLDGMEHSEPESEKGLCWIELLSLPREDPLKNLYAGMESFRRVCTDKDLVNLNLDCVKNFVPIGEWGGPLCMNLNQMNVQTNCPATWQICRFDETVFDWKDAGYLDDKGMVIGDGKFPDFKTLLEVYFYGKYDKAYEQQLRDCGEEMPDYSFYIQKK